MAKSPILSWYRDDGIPISFAGTGKLVWLVGHYKRRESRFTIRKRNWIGGMPLPRKWMSTTVIQLPTSRDGDVVRSNTPWPADHNWRDVTGRSTYFFVDRSRNRSNDLRVSSVADVSFEEEKGNTKDREAGVAIPLPGVPIVVGLGAKGKSVKKLRFKGKVTVPTDPTLELDLITPWGDDDKDLREYIAASATQVAEEQKVRESAVESIIDISKPWVTKQAKDAVEIGMSHSRLSVSEGEPAYFDVTLSFREPTKFIFAVRARDVENPDRFALSEMIAVEAVPAG